jgi:hypothetical protein
MRLITPSSLNLPTGKYYLSMEMKVTRKKSLFPLVYQFSKWNDNILTPKRVVNLNSDTVLTAEYKVASGATLRIWTKTIGSSPIALFKRFNEFYKRYPLLFWIIGIIISRLFGATRSSRRFFA